MALISTLSGNRTRPVLKVDHVFIYIYMYSSIIYFLYLYIYVQLYTFQFKVASPLSVEYAKMCLCAFQSKDCDAKVVWETVMAKDPTGPLV